MDAKNIAASTNGHTLPPNTNQISVINSMLKSLLLEVVKVCVILDDKGKESNLSTDKAIRFFKFFFYKKLGFIKSHSCELGDIEGFVQLIQGTYKRRTGADFV